MLIADYALVDDIKAELVEMLDVLLLYKLHKLICTVSHTSSRALVT